MIGLGQIVVQLLQAQAAQVRGGLTIFETGTMFVTELERGETDLTARSTYGIAKYIKESGMPHKFFSIDIDGGHIGDCREALGEYVDFVTHVKGPGKESLAELVDEFGYIPNFVLLDADSDADVIAEEFQEVSPAVAACGGIIVIDDVFKRHDVNKGRVVLKQLERAGRPWYNLGHIAAGIPFGKDADAIVRRFAVKS